MLRTLLSTARAHANAADARGLTPLFYLARGSAPSDALPSGAMPTGAGDAKRAQTVVLACAKTLLSCGARVSDCADDESMTAAHYAAAAGDLILFTATFRANPSHNLSCSSIFDSRCRRACGASIAFDPRRAAPRAVLRRGRAHAAILRLAHSRRCVRLYTHARGAFSRRCATHAAGGQCAGVEKQWRGVATLPSRDSRLPCQFARAPQGRRVTPAAATRSALSVRRQTCRRLSRARCTGTGAGRSERSECIFIYR